MRSNIEPMKDIARMLRRHQELILNWFRAKKQFNNGIVEGMNLKWNLTVRKAFGFRTFKALQIASFHQLGDLPEPQFTHEILLTSLNSFHLTDTTIEARGKFPNSPLSSLF